MKTISFFLLFFLNTDLFAYTVDNYTPSHYTVDDYPAMTFDQEGGTLTKEFSDANAQSEYTLDQIDQGQYSASWLGMGALFRDLITQEQWVGALKMTREPLGYLKTRKVISNRGIASLPHGTGGHFMIIMYQSSFSRAEIATETVILSTEGLFSKWKVISYKVEGSF